MADDTRVTRSRSGLACAFVLFWALCCALPGTANAGEIIVRRDPGLSAGQRADVRADAGVQLERILALADSELVPVPDAQQRRAPATLNADPDVQYAAPNVSLHVPAAQSPPKDAWFPMQWDLEQARNDAD